MLARISSMPAVGDFNPNKEINNNAYAIAQTNHNSSSLYTEGATCCIGYDKIAFCRTNSSGFDANYWFKDAGGNNISSTSLPSPNTWSSYIDIPENAVSAGAVIYGTSGKVIISMLTADSPYNPDNQV